MFRHYFKNKSIGIVFDVALVIVSYLLLVTLLVEVEKISDQSTLTTYPNAIWYTIVTLTTVGYGDLFPATVYGRLIGAIFVLLSLSVHIVLVGAFVNVLNTFKKNKKMGLNGIQFKGHAVIIGWNEFGKMVTEQLIGVNKQVAIVTDKKEDLDFIREQFNSKSVFVLLCDQGNIPLLEKVNIRQCSIAFVNFVDDTEKLVFILKVKKKFPDVGFVVTLENGDLRQTFLKAGVTNTVSQREISSKLLASYIFEPDVATYSESIMSYAQSDADYDIKQLLINTNNPYIGKHYHDVFIEMKKRYNSILIGITKRDKYGAKRLIKNPLGELKITAGDYLLLILNGKAFKLLKKTFKVDEGIHTDQTSA